MSDRLTRQIAFLIEADKLKTILRHTPLVDSSRPENSAEHSWHLVLTILILQEYGAARINWLRVLEMVAIHDLVEIDAGDTFAYDSEGQTAKAEKEAVAAERIFGLLPGDQQARLRALWLEFEAQETDESRFANAVDRLQPLLLNAHAGGGSWCGASLEQKQVIGRMAPIEGAMPTVWPHVLEVIETFCAAGVIARSS